MARLMGGEVHMLLEIKRVNNVEKGCGTRCREVINMKVKVTRNEEFRWPGAKIRK